MYQWQPSKWIKWAPVMAGLPFLAAGWLQTPAMVADVTQRAAAAAGDWAKVELDGRDAKLSGSVTSQEALDSAVKAVADTYGVRTVDATQVKITPPVALAAPTIESLITNKTTPEITGTWPQDTAKTLTVTLNNKTYKLGTDAELTSNAGKWTLKPAAVANGAYDVTAEVSDGGKSVTAATAPGKLVVDTVPPIVPTLAPLAPDAKWPYAMTGSWPEAAGSSLAITLADKSYTLGKDDALKSDGKGTFTFDPKVDLKPGKYDLSFTVKDAAGNVTPFVAAGAIVIPEPKVEAKPAPVPAPLAPPTVNVVAADTVWPYAISGTWPEGEAKKLSIDLNGKTYEMGSKELISDGKGKFTFMPSVDLKPGKYDLALNLTDSANKVTTTVVKDAIIVAAAAPPPPAPKPEPVKLTAPTVETLLTDKAQPVIKGTWQAGVAKSLSVTLAGKTYKLGKDFALLTDSGGHWSLKPAAPLANGVYDVVAEVSDGAGASLKDATAGELTVKIPPPPPPKPEPLKLTAPTVETLLTDKAQPVIKGTWQAGIAKSLSVTLAGKTYKLGKDFALLTDSGGHWSLKPAAPLANGVYDVVAEVSDGAGASLKDATAGELIVKIPPPPPPKPEPVKLTAPTIETLLTDKAQPVIKGTWQAGIAKSLSVTLAGKTYKLGKDFALLTDSSGHWSLKPAAPLANGVYDVVAEVSDGAGALLKDATAGELIVKIAPPPAPKPAPAAAPKPAPMLVKPAPVVEMKAPTVEASTSDSDHPVIKGTWNAGVAKSLTVSVDGVGYKLGTDYSLLTDSAGHWTLTAKKALVNGTYDVIAEESDGAGKTLRDSTKDELVVKVAAPPPPPPAAQPYDCIATMARISAVFPVRFAFNKDDLKAPFDMSVNQYIALLKDPRCLALKVQVEGHADYLGSEKYNQGLSERRAATVVAALTKAGIAATRLSAKGFSKDRPLDPATNDTARAKNRRVEFSIIK